MFLATKLFATRFSEQLRRKSRRWTLDTRRPLNPPQRFHRLPCQELMPSLKKQCQEGILLVACSHYTAKESQELSRCFSGEFQAWIEGIRVG